MLSETHPESSQCAFRLTLFPPGKITDTPNEENTGSLTCRASKGSCGKDVTRTIRHRDRGTGERGTRDRRNGGRAGAQPTRYGEGLGRVHQPRFTHPHDRVPGSPLSGTNLFVLANPYAKIWTFCGVRYGSIGQPSSRPPCPPISDRPGLHPAVQPTGPYHPTAAPPYCYLLVGSGRMQTPTRTLDTRGCRRHASAATGARLTLETSH